MIGDKNIYEGDAFELIVFKNREDWLKGRSHSIGGSDVSALVGMNPYRTNHDLWMDKIKGQRVQVTNDLIEHGIALEPILRSWFAESYGERYWVYYQKDAVLKSNKLSFASYSPDGLLLDITNGKTGVWECKTTLIQSGAQLDSWRDAIPQHYYLQTLWGLIVTGFDFVILTAELRFSWDRDKVEIRNYHFTRDEVEEDIAWLEERAETEWNKYFASETEPPVLLTL